MKVVLGPCAALLAALGAGIAAAVAGDSPGAHAPRAKPFEAPGLSAATRVFRVSHTSSIRDAAPSATSRGARHITRAAAADRESEIHYVMKLVNETVSEADLDAMQRLGIEIVEGEWGMDEASIPEVRALLDRLNDRGMQLIVNFSDNAGWGYSGTWQATQAPEWQHDRVLAYVEALSGHPGVFGYDVCNEAGTNLPNGERYAITAAQMRKAADSVRSVDPAKPVLIRMHYWDEYDGDFTRDNPFEAGIADIVMLNLYSNYSHGGAVRATPDMISQSTVSLLRKIQDRDPDSEVWVSIAAFREDPHFLEPKPETFARELSYVRSLSAVSGIAFFGWGPERYPEAGHGWYLPRDGRDILRTIERVLQAERRRAG